MTVLTENLQTMTGVNWRREVRFYVPLVEGGYAAAGAVATAVVNVAPDANGLIVTPELPSGRGQVRVDGHAYDFGIPTTAAGNDVQMVIMSDTATTLTYGGQTTASIAVDATAATVQAALEALPNIEVGDVAVLGDPGGPFTILFKLPTGIVVPFEIPATFIGTAGDVSQMTASTAQVGTKLAVLLGLAIEYPPPAVLEAQEYAMAAAASAAAAAGGVGAMAGTAVVAPPTGVVATDTAHIQTAINSGKPVYIPDGYYVVNSLTIPTGDAAGVLIQGAGAGTEIAFATPNSALFTLTVTQKRLQLQNLHLVLTAAATNSILVDLSGTFTHSFRNVIFQGQHLLSSVSTFKTQIGVKLRDNAGDNRFTDCEFNNLGNAVRTDSIQNHLVNCLFSSCWKGVIGGDPTGAVNASGISLTNCSFTGGTVLSAPTTDAWIEVTGAANMWWLHNIWIEGCDKGIVVGNGTYGPHAFGISNLKVAATTKCIDIVAAQQTYLTNITFDPDQGGVTPTDLTVNSTNAADGFAANFVTYLSHGGTYEIPPSTFPAHWTYASRSSGLITSTTKVSTDEVYTKAGDHAFAVRAPASSNAFLEFWGSAGGYPSINMAGTPSDIGVVLTPKGSGAFRVYMGTGQYTAIFGADGVESDIYFNFQTKGGGRVQENGNIITSQVGVPATATSAGKVGQWAADTSFHYDCVATNTWRRVAHASW